MRGRANTLKMLPYSSFRSVPWASRVAPVPRWSLCGSWRDLGFSNEARKRNLLSDEARTRLAKWFTLGTEREKNCQLGIAQSRDTGACKMWFCRQNTRLLVTLYNPSAGLHHHESSKPNNYSWTMGLQLLIDPGDLPEIKLNHNGFITIQDDLPRLYNWLSSLIDL